MPNSFQYPLERQRDLQRKWGRLLQRTAAAANASVGSTSLLDGTMSPRVPNNDDDQEDEDEDEDEDEEEEEDEKHEPAVTREPDKDE